MRSLSSVFPTTLRHNIIRRILILSLQVVLLLRFTNICQASNKLQTTAKIPSSPLSTETPNSTTIPNNKLSSDTVDVVIGVDGGTESIRACCFNAHDGRVIGRSHAVPYTTFHPHPGWAEQNPKDWWENLGAAVRGALDSVEKERYNIKALCIDTTCCSVVALDSNKEPLRPCLLWMDARSAKQTEEIMNVCAGDPALDVNCGGKGPISAEWMTPKALWIRQNEPDIWEKADTICEYQDYINYKLTGVMCASSCNAATRWHWNGEQCLSQIPKKGTTITKDVDNKNSNPSSYAGRPISMYKKLGIPELLQKLPERCIPMGSLVGHLTSDAAQHLSLPENLPVAQGGPDAFVGMIGLGCIRPGQLCLITGSSHLHCVITSKPTTAPGTWGAYRGAPLPGLNFAEGGQSSTGSIIRWARSIFGSNSDKIIDYKTLDEESKSIPPGSDGLVALETFQGSRTPITDPLARGALVGLTLAHTRSHIWKALMEAVSYGTRACVKGLERAGHPCDEIILAGGITRSSVWLQMHADITGKPVILCENADAPLLGCAILASYCSGNHDTIMDAVNDMVRTKAVVKPIPPIAQRYSELYKKTYSHLAQSVLPVVHSIAKLRGGANHNNNYNPHKEPRRLPIISPSLLASDWANIESEIKRCILADLMQLHVDVFDGVFLNSPRALTFGTQMVGAMRSVSDDISLDIHLCVHQPARYVEPMSENGADRIIFQWEAMGINQSQRLEGALRMAKSVVDHEMSCGISVNPETDLNDIFPLLKSHLIDVVNILAVEPGFGGQAFQSHVLEKIRLLRQWLDSKNLPSPIKIMVDGGINSECAKSVIKAGADVLVVGSFLFSNSSSLSNGASDILNQ